MQMSAPARPHPRQPASASAPKQPGLAPARFAIAPAPVVRSLSTPPQAQELRQQQVLAMLKRQAERQIESIVDNMEILKRVQANIKLFMTEQQALLESLESRRVTHTASVAAATSAVAARSASMDGSVSPSGASSSAALRPLDLSNKKDADTTQNGSLPTEEWLARQLADGLPPHIGEAVAERGLMLKDSSNSFSGTIKEVYEAVFHFLRTKYSCADCAELQLYASTIARESSDSGSLRKYMGERPVNAADVDYFLEYVAMLRTNRQLESCDGF